MIRLLTSLLMVLLAVSCTTTSVDDYTNPDIDKEPTDNDEYAEVNTYTDLLISKKYLWNDEYNTLTRDIDQDFESFFYNTLLKMETNAGDRYNDNHIFSYIYRTKASDSKATAKTMSLSFGIVGIKPFVVSYDSDMVYFIIEAIYTATPAEEAGLKHGTIITAIDGKRITKTNYTDYYYELLEPALSGTISLTLQQESEPVSITSKMCQTNPILKSEVIEQAGEKIGYLNYAAFEKEYNNELIEVLEGFKQSEISELILDLRYNGGGYLSTANLLSSAIASAYCKDKIFTYYRANDTRMKSPLATAATLSAQSDGVDIYTYFISSGNETYALDLPRLYCIIDYRSASASETVINSLRGIDFEVTLIGQTSVGKNVGMEVTDKVFDDYNYTIAPTSFQSYNAKKQSNYDDGFTPDYTIYDYPYESYPFPDLGKDDIMVAKALELIAGSTMRSTTRSDVEPLFNTSKLKPLEQHKRLSGSLVQVKAITE